MNIIVNGKIVELSKSLSLKDFLYDRKIAPEKVFVALNGNVISPHDYENEILKDGDSLELVSFVGGG